MSSPPSRIFAVVPAAGASRRMGKPKLLLPWRGRTLIDSLLEAWTTSEVTKVVVVCRKDDTALIEVCEKWSVEIVLPEKDPPDMKRSIQEGVAWIDEHQAPTGNDYWMVAPADLPTLRAAVINRIIRARDISSVVVPRFDGHACHPVLLPWSMSRRLWNLKENEGLKSLIERHAKRYVDFAESAYAPDVDTPEDYERLSGEPTR